jgi:hypothetical protein
MEENNKDLSSLLDKFNEKHKEFRAEKNNADKRVSDFKDEFKDIAINKIKPIMVRYGELLESKNIGYHIGEHFDVRYSPIKDPSISMIIDFNTEASRQASTKRKLDSLQQENLFHCMRQKWIHMEADLRVLVALLLRMNLQMS